MLHRLSTSTALLTLMFASAQPAPAQTRTPPAKQSIQWASIDDFHSPAVFGAFELQHRSASDTISLRLLVLWRGSPGWLDKALRNEGLRPAGADRRQNTRLQLGSLDLDYGRDLDAGTIRFMGVTHQLKGANVVLIDSVDAPAGHQTVTLLTVDPVLRYQGSMGPRVDSLILHTPALLNFLDCGRSATTILLRKVAAEGVCGVPGRR